jgi:hypothetical protein
VDLVALPEDEGSHLGVPKARLVAEVDTSFQHFAHGDRHENSPKVGSEIQPPSLPAMPGLQAIDSAATPLRGWFAIDFAARLA